MHWIELTVYGSSKKIFVNMAQASSFESDGRGTKIWFLAGQPDGKVVVEETPATITSLMAPNA